MCLIFFQGEIMKKALLTISAVIIIIGLSAFFPADNDYKGVDSCAMCHSGKMGKFPGFDKWKQTLHSQIHELPTKDNMIGDYTKEISMGTNFGNAKASFSIEGNDYFIILTPSSGENAKYKIEFTYGIAWKQRYLVKIGESYYMPPVQWNLNNYKDNSSGKWVTYNPQNWFNSDGTLKPINNSFKSKSWDKKCAGCHVVPGSKIGPVTLNVSGTDSSWTYKVANNHNPNNMVIGCESCHGAQLKSPGDGHVNNLKNLNQDRKLEVCGQCHFRGYSKGGIYDYPYDETANLTYQSGQDLNNYIQIVAGYWPYDNFSRQHHQQFLDFKETDHYEGGMTCISCHDPHQSLGQPHQLTSNFMTIEDGQGCVKCHSKMAESVNGINKHSKHKQENSSCIACHMSNFASSGKGYDISTHSFKVVSPEKTTKYKDNSATKGMPNSCALSCHRNGQGSFGSGTSFGITDNNLGDWTEASDLALADTLNKYYKMMFEDDNSVSIETTDYYTALLSQNYPNPFYNSTNIEFAINKSGNVKVEIYSISGQLINILANDLFNAGAYKLNWDGRSVDGFILPSGTYLCRLSLNGKVLDNRRIIIAR